MTILDEIKEFEGKTALISTENGSVYIGRVSNVRPGDEKDVVALIGLKYKRIGEEITLQGTERTMRTGETNEFPVRRTDKFFHYEND